ncbi:MAG: sulfurtransferase [Gammaproteobacteria bacterium]|nr:sulfurtransferase [Gammaproteobacteria bacterium]
MQRFSPSQLAAYLQQSDKAPLLLDVREPWEFARCHIPGSELIPMHQIPLAVEQARLDPGQEIVVICHHGIRSRQVAYYLEHQGFTKMINLEGGVEAWAQDVDPTMERY